MNRRLQEVKNSLGKTFDAILVSSIPNIIYLTNFNGFSDKEREAYLLLTKNAHYVFTDGRYAEVASKIKGFKLVRTSPNRNFGQALKGIVGKEKIKKLAIDERDIKVSETLQIKKVVKTCPDKNLIEKLRATKDTTEIKNIQAACRLGDQVFEYILSEIKLGITEKEIANKIEIFILQKGTQISFKPVVAFAANSSSPHHVAGNTKLKKNNIVLLDFGVKLNNYCSDMTRVVFFKKATDKQKKIYQTVLEAQLKAVEFIKLSIINHRPINASEVDKIAREYIKSQDFPSIPHSLGHGIGLDVHEKPSLSPKSKGELKQGMVFSIEPGIYFPDFGGIRIEDLFLLTQKGPQKMTSANNKLIEL